MPELPEVEIVRKSLSQRIVGRVITDVEVLFPGLIQYPEALGFAAELPGRRIEAVRRRGKYLLFDVGDRVLIIHLRMSGRLLHVSADETVHHHCRLIFHLNEGDDLRFIDQRKFGLVYLVPQGEVTAHVAGLASMGPEPLSADFTVEGLGAMLAERRATVKSLLLDQRRVAGIGNIYADEALHLAGIRPKRPGGSLDPAERCRLRHAIRQVLEEGLAHGGTTIRDYVDGQGRVGGFQHHLRVYGREGEPCKSCGSEIQRVKVAGRSSFFCAECQH